jgi:hypothetical protein
LPVSVVDARDFAIRAGFREYHRIVAHIVATPAMAIPPFPRTNEFGLIARTVAVYIEIRLALIGVRRSEWSGVENVGAQIVAVDAASGSLRATAPNPVAISVHIEARAASFREGQATAA